MVEFEGARVREEGSRHVPDWMQENHDGRTQFLSVRDGNGHEAPRRRVKRTWEEVLCHVQPTTNRGLDNLR